MVDKSKESESIALNVHWNLYSEWNNKENSEEVRDFYRMCYDELMAELQDHDQELLNDLEETITFRRKLLDCSNFVKSQT